MKLIALLAAALGCSTSAATPDAGDAGPVYVCPAKDAGGDCRGPDGGFLCTDSAKPWCVAGQCSESYGYCASDPTLLEPCGVEATCAIGICNVGDYCMMKEGFKGTCQCSGP
jgi:hypothetical protein